MGLGWFVLRDWFVAFICTTNRSDLRLQPFNIYLLNLPNLFALSSVTRALD